jgi:replication initiation and membrane attachment protein
MKKQLTILPADTYTVVNKTVLNDSDKKIITMLYQPIIGFSAVSLYLTLIDDLDKLEVMSEDLTHHHLMATMQLKLEATGLLKTYVKCENVNHYVYMLFSPISASEFFNHPILNIVLYNNLGKKEYDKLSNYYKIPKYNLKDYNEITSSFDEVFTSVPGNSLEKTTDIVSSNANGITLTKSLDFDMLISSIPNNMINEKCFLDETKELINSLAFTYNIDEHAMIGLIRDSLNEKGLIDKSVLRKNARNYYQFEEAGSLPTLIYNRQPEYLKKPSGDTSKWSKMVYTFENISPYDLLKATYKDGKPTSRDLRLIENLLIEQKLKPGVVNVLIAYVLKINNQKLSKNYVETIVGQWKRLNIETVDDAMKITEKEHKKVRRMVSPNQVKNVKQTTKEELPIWFNKNLEAVEVTDAAKKEMGQILEELV